MYVSLGNDRMQISASLLDEDYLLGAKRRI